VLKEFEQQHPDITIKDMLDPDKPLPGNSLFAKSVNRVKNNLVTIEQTSGCLSSHAYSYLIPFAFSIK